jgi:hypothetical protein
MSRAVELIIVMLLPTAAGYGLLGSFRLMRWAGERRWRTPVAVPAQRLKADLRRLRADLEAAETRTDMPARQTRLRAARGAYLDALATACRQLEISPPPGGDRVPQAEIYRAEAALRQRGLDVRAPAPS